MQNCVIIYLFIFLRNKERGATCCVIKVVGLKNKFAKNFKIEIKIIIFVTIIHLSCDRLWVVEKKMVGSYKNNK